MTEAYAHAVLQVIERGMEPAEAIRRLREVLDRDGKMALLPRIARALERLKDRTDDAVLLVAREEDIPSAQTAAAQYESTPVSTAVDDTLIGGWRLEAGSTLVDASYKKHLLDMYRKLTRNHG